MFQIKDIKLPVNHDNNSLRTKIAKEIGFTKIFGFNNIPEWNYKILRRSIDARQKPLLFFVYSILINTDSGAERKIKSFHHKDKNYIWNAPERYSVPETGNIPLSKRPVIIGSGPSGLFAAYLLAQRGFSPLVIERGQDVDERTKTVEESFMSSYINPESNVQFGEGGAGTFSDGKLNTLTKDLKGRNSYVIESFVRFGASEECSYNAKPHIGTDVLKSVVKNFRNEIIRLGGEFRFNTKMTGINIDNSDISRNSNTHTGTIRSIVVTDLCSGKEEEIATDILLLCIGHSARDTFEMLYNKGIFMSSKDFAAGFRIVHPQRLVNFWQYGTEDPSEVGLCAADYKVTNETSKGRRVYSFCMCPGGYVVNASSENNRCCVNGMSESKRDGEYANSAIVVGVTREDFRQNVVPFDHPLAGMYYQRELEEEAFLRGKGKIPAQFFGDFEDNKNSCSDKPTEGFVKGTVQFGNLRDIFSQDIDEAVIESVHRFGYTRKNFDNDNIVLLGIEPRTSSPVRINRDEDMLSNYVGIYPCGEGAGYAGGITSAAADGLKVAEAVISKYYPDYVK